MEQLSKNKLRQLAAYRIQKRCDEEGLFVVEGPKLSMEALTSGFVVRVVCATEVFWAGHPDIGLSEGSEAFVVSQEQLERLSNQRSPNRVWVLLERKRDEASLLPRGAALTLALDGLQDPGNMGTILRIADWYGIRDVVCSRDTVSAYNPKVVQASMGAVFRTRFRYTELAEWIKEAAVRGAAVYGAFLGGEDIYRAELESPAVLVIGNEGNGIRPEVAESITRRVTIPNPGGTAESLNAAVATAILCSEFYRYISLDIR